MGKHITLVQNYIIERHATGIQLSISQKKIHQSSNIRGIKKKKNFTDLIQKTKIEILYFFKYSLN